MWLLMKNRLVLYFVWSMASAWMIGISLKFIVDSYINNKLYVSNHLDVAFDWTLLLWFGILLFVILILDLKKYFKENEKNVEEKNIDF